VDTSPDLLDPKNDYVFKRLFVRAPELLVALINAVRVGEGAPIAKVIIRNAVIDGEELGNKSIALDILAEDEHGRRYDIEMQVRLHPALSVRNLFYLAKVYAQQLKTGEDYSQARPVIGIHLVDFELFTETKNQRQQAHWRFEFRDRRQPSVRLSDQLILHIIELPKADRLGLTDRQETDLQAWVKFFKHWKEHTTMSALDSAPVQQAWNDLQRISADEEERYKALARERALSDAVTERNFALREGEHKGQAAMLRRQLTKRFGPLDESTQARLQHATQEQLEHWSDRILDAPTLSAVFDPH
jgi:predicted transposase/invertase (TIGR01784 family)